MTIPIARIDEFMQGVVTAADVYNNNNNNSNTSADDESAVSPSTPLPPRIAPDVATLQARVCEALLNIAMVINNHNKMFENPNNVAKQVDHLTKVVETQKTEIENLRKDNDCLREQIAEVAGMLISNMKLDTDSMRKHVQILEKSLGRANGDEEGCKESESVWLRKRREKEEADKASNAEKQQSAAATSTTNMLDNPFDLLADDDDDE